MTTATFPSAFLLRRDVDDDVSADAPCDALVFHDLADLYDDDLPTPSRGMPLRSQP